MLIESLEVNNFGVLSGPLKLDLSPGLNVVFGPNESGKSTLMRALWMGLTSYARLTGQALLAIQPKNGAIPEVAVTFLHQGVHYRIHKRFSGPRGLSRLTAHMPDGHIEDLNGEDAEVRVRQVLGLTRRAGSGTQTTLGIWPLFWVRQGHSNMSPNEDLNKEGAQSLMTRIRAAHRDLLAGDQTGQVRKAVENEYQIFFTPTGQTKKKTDAPLYEALRNVDISKSQYANLANQREVYEAARERMDMLQQELREVDKELPVWEQRQKDVDAELLTLQPMQEQLHGVKARLDAEQLRMKRTQELRETRHYLRTHLARLEADLATRERAWRTEATLTPSFASVTLQAIDDVVLKINGEKHRLNARDTISAPFTQTANIRIGDLVELRIDPPQRLLEDRKQRASAIERARNEVQQSKHQLTAHVSAHGEDDSLIEAHAQAMLQLKAAKAAEEQAKPLKLRIAQLRSKQHDATQKLEGIRLRRARISEQVHETRGRLAGMDMLGFNERIAEAESTLASWTSRAQRLSGHANAIRLLYETIEACRKEAEHQLIEPVEREITELLHLLFPKSTLSLERDLSIGALHRIEQGRDSFGALSMGTREQIGIAARLGTALALAREESIPVILDDALIATDETRLASMADVLGRVCGRLQVLLLTCHWSRYQNLDLPAAHIIDLERMTRER